MKTQWHHLTVNTEQLQMLIQSLKIVISDLSWMDYEEQIANEVHPLLNYLETETSEQWSTK